MAEKVVLVHDFIDSDTVAVNGRPIYVGGHQFSVQKEGPGALMSIGGSNDKANWVNLDTAQGDAIRSITARVLWARGQVAADTANRQFHFGFSIFKDQ